MQVYSYSEAMARWRQGLSYVKGIMPTQGVLCTGTNLEHTNFTSGHHVRGAGFEPTSASAHQAYVNTTSTSRNRGARFGMEKKKRSQVTNYCLTLGTLEET